MSISNNENPRSGSEDLAVEVILQRIFHETDGAAQKAAIWDLIGHSDDWEVFQRVCDQGGRKSLEGYFNAILENFDAAADTLELDSEEQRDQIRELYASPLLCLHHGDWAGSAAAMHEILLNEIYQTYPIKEELLPFEEATAYSLKPWVNAEVLFPLSILEYMAYSDYLTTASEASIVENCLAFLLTLFFSAQAYLDVRVSSSGDADLVISPSGDL